MTWKIGVRGMLHSAQPWQQFPIGLAPEAETDFLPGGTVGVSSGV